MLFIHHYISDIIAILKKIDASQIDKIIELLVTIRAQKGRLFFLGVGGSAANCLHAVNDFRKLTHLESYTPLENIAELTARTNDEGWNTVFYEWLKLNHLSSKDGVFILSVGGGDIENNISTNIVYALKYAKEKKSKILGIVGRNGGYTAKVANACLIIPIINSDTVTAHTESLQSVICHLIVSDPRLMYVKNKWEEVLSQKVGQRISI